jgi:hypothetical protein
LIVANCWLDEIWPLLPHGAIGFGYGAVDAGLFLREKKKRGKKRGWGFRFHVIPSRVVFVQRERERRKKTEKERKAVSRYKSLISVFMSCW